MMERISITIPKDLEEEVKKKSRELNMKRSELVRKAIEAFFGMEEENEERACRKYGPIYDALSKENSKLSNEVMKRARKTLPSD